MKIRLVPIAIAASIAASLAIADAQAVSLDPDGLGQALVYPYYTVQSAGGNAFNTYLSVVNHTGDAKAIRVRFREGRMSREVIAFNLYLGPNDAWTAAIVPTEAGARLITADLSCTDPPFFTSGGSLPYVDFNNFAFSGAADDGFGTGLDRTREGYVEMIEMATLTGASAAQASHLANGQPADCAALRASTPAVAAPTGGLSGSLTLMNVNNGADFTFAAEALADLSTRPFFRAPIDGYPDFDAQEVDPVSTVATNGFIYHSTWSRPVDAVSAVLMRSELLSEYILDNTTRSRTDWVVTLPTRRFYATPTVAAAPFMTPWNWAPTCGVSIPYQPGPHGEEVKTYYLNREARTPVPTGADFPERPPDPPPNLLCGAATVLDIVNGSIQAPVTAAAGGSLVLGSLDRGFGGGSILLQSATLFQNGWVSVKPTTTASLASLATSTRVRLATGEVAFGSHSYFGLPMIGFVVSTYANGTLTCSAQTCQGNYGVSLPLRMRRAIAPGT